MADGNGVVESGGGDLRRSLELLWGRSPEPTRGPKPGLSIPRIVKAAIEVADVEGLGALSMRRLATALDAGAMSLYRYVPGKAELIDLMVDEVSGEDIAAVERLEGDWRTRMEALAHHQWGMFLRHPWMLQIAQGRPLIGPNSMIATEAWLRTVDGVGLTEHEMMAAVIMVGSFVAGIARTTVEAMQAADRTGITDEEWWGAQSEYLATAVMAGRLPMLAKLGNAGVWQGDYDMFGFGLARVLDGLGQLVEARAGVTPSG